ncbi:MAG: hypothetical protein DDT33_01639 [Firmicutes bacterium]|nr:hypothetical protein [Bacillota bacterium]
MISKLIGTWLMVDGLASMIAFRQQRKLWQAVRAIRVALGLAIFLRRN